MTKEVRLVSEATVIQISDLLGKLAEQDCERPHGVNVDCNLEGWNDQSWDADWCWPCLGREAQAALNKDIAKEVM